MESDEIRKAVRRKQLEASLRQEFGNTLSDRAERFERVHVPGIIPYQHFSPVLDECEKLFRDGHYYGCIALTQAVAEAVVRFLLDRNDCPRAGNFQTDVNTLRANKHIDRSLSRKLLKIWEHRNKYHHLEPTVRPPTDPEQHEERARHRAELEELAEVKTRLLLEAVAEAFRWSVNGGKLVVEKPKYWKKK